jgi:ATP-dependent RNA helicase MSS116
MGIWLTIYSIAQAKTGTGKTLGFLIPVIQRIIEKDPLLAQRPRGYRRAKADDIRAIIVSPTRELAEQIAVEAKKVTMDTGIVVQTAVGGTQKRAMLQKTLREGCHLLIATPGRLNDILSDSYSGIKAPNLDAFVMDEADRLLDEGFTKEIDEIKKFLPDPEEVPRQTLMFSATLSREVVDLVRRTLKPGFHFAQCVNADEAPTHERIPQKAVHLNGFENIMPALYELVLRETAKAKSGGERPFKAIVYFNSTAEVTLASSVFYKLSNGFRRDNPLYGTRAYEIHAKLTQAARTKAADNFRFAKSGILFSSDVTARGMDFPNVSHVIQIGLPRDADTYVHRLGRTGRAGKEGEGWIFLSPLEQREMRKRLRHMPLKDDTSLEVAALDLAEQGEVPEHIAELLKQIVDVHQKVYPDQLEAAFRGLFGSFQWFGDKAALIEAANRWAELGWGMPTAPRPPASVYMSQRGSGRGRSSFGGRGGGGRGFSNGNERLFGGRNDNDRGFGGRGGGDRGDRGYGGRGDRDFGGRGDRDFGGRGGGDRDFGGRGGGDRSFAGRSGDDRSFGGRSGGDRSFGGRSGGDRSFGGRSGGDQSFGGRGDRSFGGRGGRGGGDRADWN